MRGAHCYTPIRDIGLGIIPADAGSTGERYGVMRCTEDHPRGCGEHTGVSVMITP